jgi:sugar phosphate isomerase/epimerase
MDLTKVGAAKKLFDDAGIGIHIVKFSPARWSDEEIDYAFKTAKAMGAKGVCDEISEEAVKKLGPIAEKHGMYAVFHNHMQFATEGFSYDPFLAVSPAVMMNFDAGHFFGSTGIHPNTIIEKYHDRTSIHIKIKQDQTPIRQTRIRCGDRVRFRLQISFADKEEQMAALLRH